METTHLIVTAGPSSGLEIRVLEEGVRIGRSSKNDISIPDDAMSRFQCRFFLKPGEGLWVSDLGSANGTLVNGKTIQEQRLNLHDEILVGNTCLRVVNPGLGAPAKPDDAESAPRHAIAGEAVPDLGLNKGDGARVTGPASALRRKLLVLVAVMAILAVASQVPWTRFAGRMPWAKQPVPVQVPVGLSDLDLSFERVEAGSSNIFRYWLDIRNGNMVVQVDDLQANRHVRREKKVAAELIRDLARSLRSTGVLELRDDYVGMAPGILESSDLTLTMGLETRRVKVVNQVPPAEFAAAREMIEEFGKNELGLAALAIDPATLVDKARAALLQGKKMWDEREVRDENLASAIQAFTECEWYLETIEPKPDFYGEAVAGKSDCQRELQRRYADLWFLAERAVKLRDWKEAQRHLKVIRAMIPDRSDERAQNAGKKLVDVERHLATEK